MPGSNSVRLRIEYSDGTVVENGPSTIKVGENTYYMTCQLFEAVAFTMKRMKNG